MDSLWTTNIGGFYYRISSNFQVHRGCLDLNGDTAGDPNVDPICDCTGGTSVDRTGGATVDRGAIGDLTRGATGDRTCGVTCDRTGGMTGECAGVTTDDPMGDACDATCDTSLPWLFPLQR